MIKTFFIDSSQANYDSSEFSWLQTLLMEEGVLGDSAGAMGLQVTQNSPAGMSVLVSAGNALIELTKSGATWKVVLMSNTQATLAISANSSGSNRVDAVIARVDADTEPNALKNNVGTIEVVPGSGASALSDAAIDAAVGADGWIRLADVTVPNAASTIVTGNIADARVQVKTNYSAKPADPKQIQFSVVASDPASPAEGQIWFNSTTHTLNYYNDTEVVSLMAAAGTPYYADAGSNDDYAISVSPAPASYEAGLLIHFKANTANTGPATLKINSLAAIPIKKNYNQDLDTNDILTDQISTVIFDGTNFQLQSPPANVNGTAILSASDNLKTSSDADVTTTATSFAKVKEIQVNIIGRIRVKFDLRMAGAYTAHGRIYVNGVAVGTDQSTTSGTFQTYSEDITVKPSDLVEIYAYTTNASGITHVQNFRIYFDKAYYGDTVVVL
jgi:hypothetical protein